jgi:2,3-bisphosphoglycerate-dependent phosphoglycerate mutase
VELSELGRRQAGAIAHRLRSESFDSVYTSDLSRARTTAETIALPHGIPVILDRRLREFSFGDWEGLTWLEIAERHPELDDARDIIGAYAPPGGETIADVIERWQSFHADVQRAGEHRVLIVTHAGMLHAAMRSMQPKGAEAVFVGRFKFTPASLSRVTVDANGNAEVSEISDARHLEAESPHWVRANESIEP